MPHLRDHPLRYVLANELHARPFPTVSAPNKAAYLALGSAGARADRKHLLALLDLFGAAHPAPDATHFSGALGQATLKWESHSEFVSYMLFDDRAKGDPFGAQAFDAFPSDWLSMAPAARLTSAVITIAKTPKDDKVSTLAHRWFVGESLAISRVLEDGLIIAGDFRIDPAGHIRFAIFANETTGQQRIGRVLQRVCEIETYKTMAMLGFAKARELGPQLQGLETQLSGVVAELNEPEQHAERTLERLLALSSELEGVSTDATFRFAATKAYETIVNQRISILRETHFHGRQTFAEFMMRRFDPAMRTVEATQARLNSLIQSAARAGDLLRTRVDVGRSLQNEALMRRMDKRADVQLRLQQTVEGLSVVAISYYAVSLIVYLAAPIAQATGLDKPTIAAIAVPVVVLGVWLAVRRIKHSIGH